MTQHESVKVAKCKSGKVEKWYADEKKAQPKEQAQGNELVQGRHGPCLTPGAGRLELQGGWT